MGDDKADALTMIQKHIASPEYNSTEKEVLEGEIIEPTESTKRKLMVGEDGYVRDIATNEIVGLLDVEGDGSASSSSTSTKEEKEEGKTDEKEEESGSESESSETSEESSDEEEEEKSEDTKDKDYGKPSGSRNVKLKGDKDYLGDKNLDDLSRKRNIYDIRNWWCLADVSAVNKYTKEERKEIKKQIDGYWDWVIKDYETNKDKLSKVDIWSKSKIKSILKDNKISREVGNKEYGILDMKKLHRIVTTGKVFKRKAINSNKNYSIVLAVDLSGSMCGSKIKNAAWSTIKFIKEYHEYIDIEVFGFSKEIVPLKSFGEVVTDEMLKEIFFLIMSSQYQVIDKHIALKYQKRKGYYYASPNYEGNHDPFALIHAQEKLKKIDGQKMIMVFSDGRPSCGDCPRCEGQDMWSGLHKEVKKIESSETKLFSIGIEDNTVKDFYKNYRIIQNSNQLSRTLVDLIGSQMKRVAIRG